MVLRILNEDYSEDFSRPHHGRCTCPVHWVEERGEEKRDPQYRDRKTTDWADRLTDLLPGRWGGEMERNEWLRLGKDQTERGSGGES
jgi:hypothetical protein